MDDKDYMKRALELAKKGEGFVSPNPMVGAVIVKDGEIIAEGWHEKYGDLHAERNALKHCTQSAEGADMYVTLEPCCHYGKQPPCVNAIIEAKIKRVIVGSGDPNPLVAGKGIQILREHGIEVVENVLKDECDKLNEIFMYYIQHKRPFVAMKYAMTMDGKIATYKGLSKWITGEKAREHVHKLRHRYKAIMAGIGTVLADDPLLTCRLEDGIGQVDLRRHVHAGSTQRALQPMPLVFIHSDILGELDGPAKEDRVQRLHPLFLGSPCGEKCLLRGEAGQLQNVCQNEEQSRGNGHAEKEQ